MVEDTLNDEYGDQPLDLQKLLTTLVLVCAIVLAAIFGLQHLQASDPYIQEVLALEGDEQRGQDIFQMNCAVCHGIEARGEVGPSLLAVSARKSQVKLIKQVVSGKTPPMPQFQPAPQDMADLLEYLETL